METSQRVLIDKLLQGIYSDEPPYNLKDDKGFTMLALQFALADSKNLVLRAHQLLDEQFIKMYTLEEVTGDSDKLQLCSSPRTLVLVEEKEKEKHLVDLSQWFCSCAPFIANFSETGVQSIQSQQQTTNYGHRTHPPIQFDLTRTDKGQGQIKEDKVPICEHLLAVYLFRSHPKKLANYVQVSNVTPEQFISLNSKLVV